jgi:hypothetical protein
MPMSGKSTSEDIREFHGGKTYSRTKKKFGKRKADKQAVAAALSNQRRGKKKKRGKGRSKGRS